MCIANRTNYFVYEPLKRKKTAELIKTWTEVIIFQIFPIVRRQIIPTRATSEVNMFEVHEEGRTFGIGI